MRSPNEKENDIKNIFLAVSSCSKKNNNAQVSMGIKNTDEGANPRTVMAPRINPERTGLFSNVCASNAMYLQFLVNRNYH